MKVRINGWYNCLAATLLSLLGFSCGDSDDDKEQPCLYGTPVSYYRVRGKVTDSEGNPVKGIKVEEKFAVGTGYGRPSSPVYTAAYWNS